MAPHDDLTAERAAIIGRHYACEDSWYSCPLAEDGCANPGEGEECTCGVDTRRTLLDKLLKTTRQAALREASQAVRNRALLWRSHGGAKVGFPYGHLTIEGEYESMADELDRLASEGAPAPIDLLHKLKDDGSYGEHF